MEELVSASSGTERLSLVRRSPHRSRRKVPSCPQRQTTHENEENSTVLSARRSLSSEWTVEQGLTPKPMPAGKPLDMPKGSRLIRW
jgi:hypothetical protein